MTLPRGLALGLLLWLVPALVVAEQDPAAGARAAQDALNRAAAALAAAPDGEQRAEALTGVLGAYENAQAQLRQSGRALAAAADLLQTDLDSRSQELARFLAVLQSIRATPAPLLRFHPAGPEDTIRAGILLADVTPALQERVAGLRAELARLEALRTAQNETQAALTEALAGAQTARIALRQAMANRAPLPRRYSDDPVQTALLIASTDSLSRLAALLEETARDLPTAPQDASPLSLPMASPVRGHIRHQFRDPDDTGIRRDGVVLATAPGALVTTPVTATIRFRGPLLDLGEVAILEPAPDVLIVFAGLAEVFAEVGEVLPPGGAIGLMAGTPAQDDAIVTATRNTSQAETSEELYIEVREATQPVDPAGWFDWDEKVQR